MEMEKDTEPTKTVFRKFRDGGDIIALFPEVAADHRGNCQSYMHVGQHSAADYYTVIQATTPAPEHECEALSRELEGYGYLIQKQYRVSHRIHRKRMESVR